MNTESTLPKAQGSRLDAAERPEPDFKNLEVWQLAHELALTAYRVSRPFPTDERFRLTDQFCRAAFSVPANIAEGQGRYQVSDQVHYLMIARGSLQETRYYLILACDLGYLSPAEAEKMENLASKLFAKLSAFIASKRRFAEEKRGGSSSRRALSLEPRARRSAPGGFTLIELLTVIAIIVLLAGLVVGISSYANRSAVESRIKAEIKAMEAALEAYKADYGGYPPLDDEVFSQADSAKGGITNVFLSVGSVLSGYAHPNTNGWLNIHYVWRALSGTNTPKTYMSFLPKQLKTVTNALGGFAYTVILDPNGNPYGYNPIDPRANPQTFDLWSAGVDGKSAYPTNFTSAVDDLGNWQR